MERTVWSDTAVRRELTAAKLVRQKVDPRQDARSKKNWVINIVPTTILVDVTRDGTGAKEIGRIEGEQDKATVLRLIDLANDD